MPKKTRKAKIRASQRPIPVAPVATPVAPSPIPSATREPVSPRIASSLPSMTAARVPSAMTTDYGYVYRDLRRIGLLALFFFGIMFVLWFLVEVQGIHIVPGYL